MRYRIIYTITSFVILISLLSSCSKIIEPHYTTVKKLYDVKNGDNLKKVNETLGVTPYDFYFNTKEGSVVYVYKYKHEYHKLQSAANSEASLTMGTPRYKEPGNIYMEFDQSSKKLLGFYTDNGKEKTLDILKHENTLRQIQKDYTKYNLLNIKDFNTAEQQQQTQVQPKKNKIDNSNNSNNKKEVRIKPIKLYKTNAISLSAFKYGIVGLNYEHLFSKKVGLEIGGGIVGASLVLKYHTGIGGASKSSVGLTLFEYKALGLINNHNIPNLEGMLNTFRWGLVYEQKIGRNFMASIGAGIQNQRYWIYHSDYKYNSITGDYEYTSGFSYFSKTKMYLEFSVGAYLPW